MKTREITIDEALAFSTKTEGHFFDRKSKAIDGRKLQKIIVAFANADGGEVVVGIADDSDVAAPENRWNGFTDLEDLNGLLQAVFSLNPTVDVRYEVLNSPSPGYVLRIFVEKGSQVHKTSDGHVYVRYGAQSIPINDPQKIMELSFAKGASSFEDQLLANLAPEIIVDSTNLKTFLSTYAPKTDPLDFTINQNLLDYKTWIPRVAAVLLFSNSPGAHMTTKCSAKVARYETREDEPERDHLKAAETIEGPLYDLNRKDGSMHHSDNVVSHRLDA